MRPIVILLCVLTAIMLAVFPVWPYSKEWGYWPAGIATVVAVAVLCWLLFGEVKKVRNTRNRSRGY